LGLTGKKEVKGWRKIEPDVPKTYRLDPGNKKRIARNLKRLGGVYLLTKEKEQITGGLK